MKFIPFRTHLSCCFFIFAFYSCEGQENTGNLNDTKYKKDTPYRRLTKNGLYDQFKEASVNVHCGFQDRSGDMWFGTTGNGIYRYNGRTFTNFTTKDGLNSDCVWAMLQDISGNIWIGTDAGLSFYDGKEIVNISISVGPQNYIYGLQPATGNSSAKNEVFSIIQDRNGVIWLGTTEGMYCYSHPGKPDQRFFTRFLDSGSIINKSALTLKSIQCMLEDNNGNIWFGSGPMAFEGIAVFDGTTLNNFRPHGETWIRNIFQGKDGTIWFGTRHYGGLRYHEGSFTYFTKKEHIGIPLLQDNNGDIWFGGDEKLNTFENEGGIWRYDGTSFKNFNIKDGISKYAVFCMLADRDQNIWVGTRNSGLYKYDGSAFISFSD